jgi:hypothetical protein
MYLPHRQNAYVPPRKLRDYLLSETHAVGKSKAKFFQSLGFDDTNIDILEQGLLLIAQTELVKDVISSPHGEKYVIDGFLQTPAGRNIYIRTVWIVEPVEDSPRFITAYPAKE